MFLVGNIVQVPIGLYLGYLSDKVKVWKLLTLCNIFNLAFGGVLIVFLKTTEIGFIAGFLGIYVIHQTIFMLVSVIIFHKFEIFE